MKPFLRKSRLRFLSNDSSSVAGERGFTLMELMIVIVIVMTLAAIGYPALHAMLARAKLSSSAREVAVHFMSARIAAMRLGRPVVVVPDYDSQTLLGWVDENDDQVLDLGEDLVFDLRIPPGGERGVYLMGADGVQGSSTDPAESVEGWTVIAGGPIRGAVFESDGSIRDAGSIRISDGKDTPNVFEVRVAPQATARLAVNKYVFDGPNGDDFYPQGGSSWKWY